MLRLERLTEQNFGPFESLTCHQDDGCYCSFWHQKFGSLADWDKRKTEEPEKNRACVLERLRSGFHLGALVYLGQELVAWVSVGPLTDFHWTWRRVGQVGDAARTVAGVPCITRAPEWRNRVTEASILTALKAYGREQGWSAIEGYPFEREIIDKLGDAVTWPGAPEEFVAAGYSRVGDHWLTSTEYRRGIYRIELES